MLKTIKFLGICLIMLVCAGALQTFAASSQKETTTEYRENYLKILNLMRVEMNRAATTGDPSIDFLNEMIPHHEAAVSMSENILKYGKNEKVKRIADRILNDQVKGIAKMKQLRNRLMMNPTIDKKAEAAYLKKYEDIFRKMVRAMEEAPATENVDRDFLNEMIPHHEGAVAMAANILAYTKDPELKKIAEQIVESQGKQLEQMKKLRTALSMKRI
ncbi:DUF305 domain-containing protein [Bacillus testis]|uniref:DUF305 domain-containing protein n=1 Tax=Bacillus testis TaxID=1622072 RepID=UPI00067EEEFF|nr:DUF305 domain-containing protein [Bacillus testis]